MQFRSKNGTCDDDRNIFTAYLLRALKRRRGDILLARKHLHDNEVVLDLSDSAGEHTWDYSVVEDGIYRHMMNMVFESAFHKLKEKEQRIVMERAFYGRKYEDIGMELGMNYKAVAAVYRRALIKIKQEMEG